MRTTCSLASAHRLISDRSERASMTAGGPTNWPRTDHSIRIPEVGSQRFRRQKSFGKPFTKADLHPVKFERPPWLERRLSALCRPAAPRKIRATAAKDKAITAPENA